MAGSGVTLYAVTAASNKTVIGTIDWREDVYMPSQINDNLAQIMADIRALANSVATGWVEIGDGDGTYTATYVSATSFRFDGVNVASYYRAGMRVRVVAPTPGTLSGTIVSSTFSTHTTLVVSWDSGQLSNEAITSVSLGIGSGGASGAQPSYRNILGRNGGFEVWQRGAGGAAVITTAGGAYTADGWHLFPTGGAACAASQTAGAGGSRWAALVQRDPGQTSVAEVIFEYPLDTDEIVPAISSIVTLSFVAWAGANWSPAGGVLVCRLFAGTGTPKRAATGFTSGTTPISGNVPLTAAATRFSLTSTVVIPAGTKQASMLFSWTPVGTAGAQDAFVIDDVQLEIGSVATPFERRPFESELLACRRHYWKTFDYNTAPASGVDQANGALGFVQVAPASTGQSGMCPSHPVLMRSAPTVTLYNPLDVSSEMRNIQASANCAGTSAQARDGALLLQCAVPAGSVPGQWLAVHATADAGI